MADPEKAFLLFENHVKIECLFNPDSLKITRANSWSPPDESSSGPTIGAHRGASGRGAPGRGVPMQHYTGATAGTMDLDLVFDTTDTGLPVTYKTGKLLQLMEPDKNLPGTKPSASNARPPTVTFHWGKLVSWPAVITNLVIEFTYFSSKGVPLRAEVDMNLTQYKEASAFGAQNPTSGTPRPHRVHRVQPGETLDRISAHYYGDPTRWRMLAAANSVEDPLTIRPGSLLTVPELES